MRDLPEPDDAMPEIVFVGRSNVGKSRYGMDSTKSTNDLLTD